MSSSVTYRIKTPDTYDDKSNYSSGRVVRFTYLRDGASIRGERPHWRVPPSRHVGNCYVNFQMILLPSSIFSLRSCRWE